MQINDVGSPVFISLLTEVACAALFRYSEYSLVPNYLMILGLPKGGNFRQPINSEIGDL